VSRNGEVELASALHKPFSSPRVSPDGRRVAVWLQDDEVGVWLLDRARDQLSKLSRGLDDHSPVWSPDGRRVAFDSSRSGHYQLYTAPADSAGEETPMTTGSLDRFVNAWLPGDRLLVTEHSMENGSDVSWIDVSANPEPQPLLHSPFMEGEPAISADGQRIAYVSDESGRKQIYVQRMSPAGPPTGPRLQVSREGGEEPVWSRSGDELFFRSGPALFSVRVSREGELSTSEPRLLFSGSFHYNLYPTATYDVAPDGRFLMVEEPPVQNRTLLVTLHARP
jgi:serine/threonine-protein kinase